MVNPLFTAAEENTATWPDPDSMEKHQAMPKAKLEELVTKRDEASQIKNPGKQLLLNDSNMVHVTERPTTKKAAIDLVSPDKESVVILHSSSTDCPIDQLTPEKRPMAGTLKSTTQKSIEAPLTDVLLNESEEAPQSSLQKVLNGELEYAKFNKDSILVTKDEALSKVDLSPSKEELKLRNELAKEEKNAQSNASKAKKK